eukprot:TRINITY_DN17360_c0_g1_i1.p1 TRINITY_DN17360_c0_g1~~TRINITY_DN17360_c0_g1_i1.p1  ORF type:complete len:622 (+),score=160.02 TRINITY_DN17360_c0_g1_i1:64-1929(+)
MRRASIAPETPNPSSAVLISSDGRRASAAETVQLQTDRGTPVTDTSGSRTPEVGARRYSAYSAASAFISEPMEQVAKSEIGEVREDAAALTSELYRLDCEVRRLKKLKAANEATIDAQRQELKHLASECAAVAGEREASKEAAAADQWRAIQGHTTRQHEFAGQLQETERAVEAMEAEVEEGRAKVDAAEQRAALRKEHRKAGAKEIAALQRHAEQLQETEARLRAEVAAARSADGAGMPASVAAAEEERRLRRRLDAIRDEADCISRDSDRANTDRRRLAAERDRLERDVRAIPAAPTFARDEISQLQLALADKAEECLYSLSLCQVNERASAVLVQHDKSRWDALAAVAELSRLRRQEADTLRTAAHDLRDRLAALGVPASVEADIRLPSPARQRSRSPGVGAVSAPIPYSGSPRIAHSPRGRSPGSPRASIHLPRRRSSPTGASSVSSTLDSGGSPSAGAPPASLEWLPQEAKHADVMGVMGAASRGGVGAAELPSPRRGLAARMIAGVPPASLFVSGPNLRELQGEYELLPEYHLSMPVWQHAAQRTAKVGASVRRIYAGTNHRWILTADSRNMPADMGVVASSETHCGRLPHAMPDWLFHDGEEWAADGSISVSDL